jgi:isoquinoline 1-oxidoreductase subunit beta
MTLAIDTSRRRFLTGSAAAIGGLTVGFHIPFGSGEAAAQGATPEINAWVVVKPDDSVIVRIARIDMGQGTVTGLCQLVAEELECDWAKVGYEYPTPGQNLARNRVWGNFQTAGSQGIRQSQEYVRKGGAAARMMLVQAAAAQWNVPAAECSVSKGVITHADRAQHDLRQGRRRGRQARGAQGRPAQGSEDLDDRGQAAAAARHRRQGRPAARSTASI